MDEQKVRALINALYDFAGLDKRYTHRVNDEVASVLATMLRELKACSSAFAWVPRPPGGRATLQWVARSIARSMIERLRDRQSTTCARAVIYKWDRRLTMAGLSG